MRKRKGREKEMKCDFVLKVKWKERGRDFRKVTGKLEEI